MKTVPESDPPSDDANRVLFGGATVKSTFRRSLVFFLPLALLVWSLVATYLHIRSQAIERQRVQDVQKELEFTERAINNELLTLLDDLHLLSIHSDLKTYLTNNGDPALTHLQRNWNFFSSAKRSYDQVRFIDTGGHERVRINHAEGTTLTVAEDQLQDKSNRYYFKESIALPRGRLFVSALDLNVEQGRIEQPRKPILRVAVPVFHEGERRGIVVLNYLAERLLRHLYLAPSAAAGKHKFLLNSDGYYLKGPGADKEWGFMYPRRAGRFLFQDDFPRAWNRVAKSTRGWFRDEQGLFAYTAIWFPPPMADWNASQSRHWILLGHVDADTLHKAVAPVRRFAFAMGGVVTLLLFFLSYYFAYLSSATRVHRKTGIDLEARLSAVMATAPDAIFSIDGSGRLESVNPAAENLFGCPFEQLRASPMEKWLPGFSETLEMLAAADTLEGRERVVGAMRRELILNNDKGGELPVELAMSSSRIGGELLYIGILRDVSERYEAAERIRRQSFFDELTDLPNRAMLNVELTSALESAKRRRMYGALLFMDMDNFKNINDSLGHSAGDVLLKQIARRIQDCLRNDDLVARLGGDEFVVMVPFLDSEKRQASLLARDLAEKLRTTLNRPVRLDSHEYIVTPSIGIVLFTDTSESADSLLKQADTAMYRAKAAGRNTVRFFQPRMQMEADERLSIGKELNKAVRENELVLYVQPQINAASGQVVGAEALLRWRHPDRGLLSPGAFISQVEELGLSGEVGDWVLRNAVGELETLLRHSACSNLDFLAVNISPLHFRMPDFLPRVQALLEQHDVPPYYLELEITENLLLRDIDEAAAKMKALQDLGIGFAIDDFGTGFSSLAYLRRLPLTRLKIDRSFIDGVHQDPYNASIVETIIAMARIQELKLTAEGVETEKERDWLLERGCEQIQGYLYSRPIPFSEFVAYCESRETLAERSEALV